MKESPFTPQSPDSASLNIPKITPEAPPFAFDNIDKEPLDSYPTPEQTYASSAHRFRTRRLRKGPLGDFVRNLQDDEPTQQLIRALTRQRESLNAASNPRTDHRVLTPFVAGIMNEPESRAAFMNALDETANNESDTLKEIARQNGHLRVDIVIVGAGVQGSVAAARLRAEKPHLAILTVDQADRLGGQFRSYGRRPTFRINSRAHRPESGGNIALPGGMRNLNPLSETSLIQLPDITTETYPTNIDFGDTAAVNQFFAAPTMLDTKLVARTAQLDTLEGLTLHDTKTDETYSVIAQKILLLTGAGERPAEMAADTVWTVERLLRHFGDSREQFPMELFLNKSIAVIGGGDSGRIAVELLARLAPKEAYARSIAQLGGPESITWYGVDFASREEFCQKNRSRYEQLRAFIANDDEPIRGARLVRPRSSRVTEITETESGSMRVADAGGNNRYFDLVVDARNLKNQVSGIAGLTGELALREAVLAQLGTVSIGKQLVGGNVYIGGPAANTSLSAVELGTFPAAIRENTVAVWANAPRVDRLAQNIAASVEPRFAQI